RSGSPLAACLAREDDDGDGARGVLLVAGKAGAARRTGSGDERRWDLRADAANRAAIRPELFDNAATLFLPVGHARPPGRSLRWCAGAVWPAARDEQQVNRLLKSTCARGTLQGVPRNAFPSGNAAVTVARAPQRPAA